jgi:ubiquinone/menaquinone biosynthesis C-methylase UbiE
MMKTVLHVGCGNSPLGSRFAKEQWREIRLDIDPRVNPDIVASIMDMGSVADSSVDAVWSSHNLEHLYAHEVPHALQEFRRVLKPGGFVLLAMPNLKDAAWHVAQGELETPLYQSPAGPISAIDILFGHRPSIARGNLHMAHKTGFTAQTLAVKLQQAGFREIEVQENRRQYELLAKAYK